MKKKILAVVTACVLLFGTIAMVGCGEDKKDNDGKELTKITFLLDWAPNTNHTGLYVALDKGFYKEAGLDVEFVQPGSMGTSGTVATGAAQFGVDFQDQMIHHESQKIETTAIAAIIQHNTSGILSKASANITRPKDMAGKSYATWGAVVEQAVVKHSITVDGGDASTLDMQEKFVENIVAEFQIPNGVDSVWSFYGWDKVNLDLEKNKVANNFFYFKDIDPALDFYTPVIVANNKYMEEHPEIVKAFLTATKKGYEFAISNPKDAADCLIKCNPELEANKELIYASQEYLKDQYKAEVAQWGFIDQARWDAFNEFVCKIESDEVPDSITKGFGFTNEFLPKEA